MGLSLDLNYMILNKKHAYYAISLQDLLFCTLEGYSLDNRPKGKPDTLLE